MTAPTSYELRYHRALVRSAVRTYVRQKIIGRQPGLWIAQVALMAFACVLIIAGSRGIAMVLAGIAVLPIVMVFTGWAAHHLYKMRRLRAMGEPVAWLSLTSDGLLIRSDAGTTQMPFALIGEVIERTRFWLLYIGSNRFVILPTTALPAALLDQMRACAVEASRDR